MIRAGAPVRGTLDTSHSLTSDNVVQPQSKINSKNIFPQDIFSPPLKANMPRIYGYNNPIK